MIDERFALRAFRQAGKDSDAAGVLAEELATAVLAEVDVVVRQRLSEIVERLGELGHNLTPEEPIEVGEVSFLDGARDETCGLRLAVDIVVSTGYAHLSDDVD